MRVSVIIPTYNYGRFVCEAVESVLNQTHPPHEVIVVDDGSTDDTAQVLKPYSGTGRICYHRQENAGLSAARNAGLSKATGEVLALLDSDDVWHPKKLEYQVAYLESHPECGLVGTASFRQEPVRWTEIGTPNAKTLPLDVHLTGTRFCPSSALLRRTLWEQVGGFDPASGGTSDRDYWIRCAAVWKVAYIEAPLVFYRVHGASMTVTKVDAMVASERLVIDKAFVAIPALHGRTLLKRRVNAIALTSAAYTLWRDAGRPREAMSQLLRSLLSWPLPLSRADTGAVFYRLQFGLRLLIAVLRG
jgi:glycosyltransferase involved in cell wall biosynthesis